MNDLPELHNYWDAPERVKMGDTEAETLYTSIGRALTSYEFVEEEFASLFADFVHSDSEAAFRAYGCIVSPSTKREMLESSAEIYFFHSVGHSITYDDELKKLNVLLGHYQKASARRNEIAHGKVIGFIVSGPKRGFHHFLVPSTYNSRKTYAATTYNYIHTEDITYYQRAKYQYVAADVEHFQVRFRQIRSWVAEYREYLNKQYSQYFPRR